MPKRTRSHELEDLSIVRLHQAFEEKGWTVEDLRKDYGEDLFVRLFHNGATTPLSFFVQAKATDNLAKYVDSSTKEIRFPVETGHLSHWVRFSEPVLLTIWDSRSDKTHWVCIQNALETHFVRKAAISKNRTMRVSVPAANLLNADGLKRIEGITKLRFARIEREKQGSSLLVERLRQELGEKIEYDGGRGALFVETSDGGLEMHLTGDMTKMILKMSQESNRSPRAFVEGMIDDEHKRLSGLSYDKAFSKQEFQEMEADRERRAAEED
jgi:hypothetical protein